MWRTIFCSQDVQSVLYFIECTVLCSVDFLLYCICIYFCRWSKTARSLPESSRRPQLQREWTFHSIDAEDLTNAAIPYRLPRIDTPRDSFCRFEHDPENVWSRHGYQNQIKYVAIFVLRVKFFYKKAFCFLNTFLGSRTWIFLIGFISCVIENPFFQTLSYNSVKWLI